MAFTDFKKKQQKITDALKKMQSQSNSTGYQDDRIWNGGKDAAGNGVATIRFLPQKDLASSPIILTFRHGFKINNKWFIEPCPVTIGEKCPVCEHSSNIWKEDEDTARQMWRTKTYVANILVVDDPAAPENNGTVKIFKFGKSIYEQLMEVAAPEDEDEEGVNIFDFDEGLNFKWKLVQKGGYNNYDKSKFVMTPTAIADGNVEEQEKIYNQIYNLSEFVDPKLFKSYDELLKKFKSVLTNVSLAASHEDTLKTQTKTEEKLPKKEKIETKPDDCEIDEDEDFDFESLLNDEEGVEEDDIPF